MGDVVHFREKKNTVDETLESFMRDDFDTVLVIGIRKDVIEFGHTAQKRAELVGLLEILKFCIIDAGYER